MSSDICFLCAYKPLHVASIFSGFSSFDYKCSHKNRVHLTRIKSSKLKILLPCMLITIMLLYIITNISLTVKLIQRREKLILTLRSMIDILLGVVTCISLIFAGGKNY